jgi:HK97 family phage prohead protease
MEPDFSGYATKAGLKCSDGRTIMPDAFKHHDGTRVPLVWQHGHEENTNVLGHAILENRGDGLYAYGFFNDTPSGQNARALVRHGDVESLSIWANKLVEKSKQVFHGVIREVSLVLSGANPGAKIDYVSIAHSDGEVETLEDEAIIYSGLEIEHADGSDDGSDDGETVQDIYDTLTDKQKDVVHYMIGAALEEAGVKQSSTGGDEKNKLEHSEENKKDKSEEDDSGALEHQEGNKEMTRNVFESQGRNGTAKQRATLTHDQLTNIVASAKKMGSFKEAFLAHAVEYGIEDIDLLFPDAKALTNAPEFIKRKTEWVAGVINGTKHTPFSRIKTLHSDITHDEARAKGYVKGTLKKEEWIKLQRRITTPTTVYKKQKLDRDDMLDITDLDVVAWLKAEMRLMLEEELARAVLIGDGREIDDEDKISEDHIRPIAHDDHFYAHQVTIAPHITGDALVEALVRARPNYRGAGNPTMYCTEALLTDLLLIKDAIGRRLYPTQAELETALRVKNIVTVEVMEDETTTGGDLLAILVNLSDYSIGADKGGQVSMFDDFDIDYNQYKYLIETRVSGALTKFKSALVFSRGTGTLVAPETPTFVTATGVVTIPDVTGVVYKQDGVVVTAGAQDPIASEATTVITAEPDVGYYFPPNITTSWTFTADVIV